MGRWLWKGVCALLGLGVGFFICFYFIDRTSIKTDNCHDQYPLTSWELDCDFNDAAARLKALDAALEKTADLYIRDGKASRISVWARDLNSKQWAAYKETDTYSPASLLKLPLMIAYYKFSELDPKIVEQEIVYKRSSSADDTLSFTPPTTLVPGRAYTVEQLIELMMKNSDNEAALTLFANVDPAFYQKTLVELGIVIPTQTDTIDYVTAKTYANIFRILFNASYIDRELSQRALDIMTHSIYKGIATALPSNVIIAHKFGERTVIGPDGSEGKHQLHDCGIIYKNNRPYSLCIMTEGVNFDDLEKVIEGLSDLTYQQL